MPSPVTLSTLGDLRARGYSARVWCTACLHDVPLDLDAMVDRLGADRPYWPPASLGLVCSSCGGRDVRLTLMPPTGAPIARGSG